MNRLLSRIGALVVIVTAIAALWYWQAGPQQRLGACIRLGICNEPAEVLGTTILSFQEQRQLVVFSARLITALTATDERSLLGMKLAEARKTLIVPATARYALDLEQMRMDDLRWDARTSTLFINRPPMHILGPEIDLAKAQEYVDGRLLLAFTRTEAQLDRINRQQAQERLLVEARQPVLVDLARRSGDEALRQIFELPLRIAGFDTVKVEIIDKTRK